MRLIINPRTSNIEYSWLRYSFSKLVIVNISLFIGVTSVPQAIGKPLANYVTALSQAPSNACRHIRGSGFRQREMKKC